MEKYIKFSDEKDPEHTNFEYEIGETITVNSVEKFRCMKKEVVDGKLIQYFKKGIITFNY